MNPCECCDRLTPNAENDYGEFVCDDCLSNKAEAAYEQLCSDFHDGGSTRFRSLADIQADARRLK